MPIDQINEQILSLPEACKVVPAVDGRRPHVSTLWRWHKKGLRDCRLECLWIGGRLTTSREALARFFQPVSDAKRVPDGSAALKLAPNRPPAQRAAAIERAGRELEAAGVKTPARAAGRSSTTAGR